MRIILSSEHKVSGSSSEGDLKLHKALAGEYVVESFVMTDRLYNVSNSNNKVYVNSYNGATASNHTLTLTNGYYSETQLRDELSMKLNQISGNTYTVTYDNKTSKYTITETSGDTFKFTFKDNTANSARKLLGFSETNTTYNSTHTSDLAVDLCPQKIIYCNIEEVGRKHIETTVHTHTDLYFTTNSSYGGVIRYTCEECVQNIHFLKTPKRIHYRFHTLEGENIDFNGIEWVIVLHKI